MEMTTKIITTNGDHDDDDRNITATDMIIDPIDCDEPCNVTIIVTWANRGNKREKFKPAIKVNDTKIELGIEIALNKNQITTQTFNLTNLMEGTYTVCPYPN